MLHDIHTHRTDCTHTAIVNVAYPQALNRNLPYTSYGMHPWHLPPMGTDDDVRAAYQRLSEKVAADQVLAIGECGLDKLRGGDLRLQLRWFERHVNLSEQLHKPLIIHCVKAFNELIGCHKQWKPHMPWIVHGFRNNLHIAEALLDEGFFLSFGEKFQTDVVRHTPLQAMFAETDESPLTITRIMTAIAQVRDLPIDEFARHIENNVRKAFF